MTHQLLNKGKQPAKKPMNTKQWADKLKPKNVGLSIGDGWNFGIGFGLAMAIAVPILLLLIGCLIFFGLSILGASLSEFL